MWGCAHLRNSVHAEIQKFMHLSDCFNVKGSEIGIADRSEFIPNVKKKCVHINIDIVSFLYLIDQDVFLYQQHLRQ